MKTTLGAAHNYIMSPTQVPCPRIEPKTLGVTCSYFTTQPLRRITFSPGTELISCSLRICFLVQATTLLAKFFSQICSHGETVFILNKGRVRPRFLHCNDCEGLFYSRIEMKTTQGASHNYIMSTTQVPRYILYIKYQHFGCN